MKALIAMSGGVDSSVSALLTQKAGYDTVGCTMLLHKGAEGDVKDAAAVCKKMGAEHYTFDFSEEFDREIIKNFALSYKKGETPNPCIECNRVMKFGKLSEKAKEMGCDYVVTGHYARIVKEGDKYLLKKALDETKDQSYVLYNFTQEKLAHTLFPLGELTKNEVRKIAEENGFLNAKKPDSQDICFVPNGDYASVVETIGGKCPRGNFINKEGEVIGEHKGIIHYTVGQHKRLGMAFGEPRYVLKVDGENNTVTLGDSEDLFTRDVTVEDFNWISGETPKGEIRCKAKIRYRQKEADCTAYQDGDKVRIKFDEPVRAVTAGQSAVLYSEDTVLGGGKIV